ncbi:hypothetical protein HDU78_001573 [Chytriomyces hyalinus]|nr:hypothetical protein HDU78_001573 [Chytriomyces hyalinus]
MGRYPLDNVQRLTNNDHARLLALLVPSLKTHFSRVGTPRFLPTKNLHADLDLVVQCQLKAVSISSIQDMLAAEWAATSKFINGTTCSYNVQGFQVDVTFLPSLNLPIERGDEEEEEAIFNAYLGCMHWGGFSHIMGVIVKQFGLKWTSRGLELVVSDQDANDSIPALPRLVNTESHKSDDDTRDDGASKQNNPQQQQQRIGEILLTRSFPDALEFLKYNPQKWQDGFLSEMDMFEYLVSSPLFSREWMLPWVNAMKPVEKMTPTTVSLFKQFLMEQHKSEAGECDYFGSNPIQKHAFKMAALHHFGKMEKYHDMVTAFLQKSAMDELMRAVFSGKLVVRVTGLDPKYDGGKIGQIKSRVRGLIESRRLSSEAADWRRDIARITQKDMEQLVRTVWDDIY